MVIFHGYVKLPEGNVGWSSSVHVNHLTGILRTDIRWHNMMMQIMMHRSQAMLESLSQLPVVEFLRSN